MKQHVVGRKYFHALSEFKKFSDPQSQLQLKKTTEMHPEGDSKHN